MQAIVASSSICTGILSMHLDRSRSRILRSKRKQNKKTHNRANFPSPRSRVTKTKTIELNLQNFTNIIRRVFVNAAKAQVLAATELIYANHARHAFAPGETFLRKFVWGILVCFGVFGAGPFGVLHAAILKMCGCGFPFERSTRFYEFRTNSSSRFPHVSPQQGRSAGGASYASYASSQTAFEQTKDSRVWCLVPIALNTRLQLLVLLHSSAIRPRGKVKYSFLPLRT